jgi:hypothetical protein
LAAVMRDRPFGHVFGIFCVNADERARQIGKRDVANVDLDGDFVSVCAGR